MEPQVLSVFYRLALRSVAEVRPKVNGANKLAYFANAVKTFEASNITVIADSMSDFEIEPFIEFGCKVMRVSNGSGGGTFRDAALLAMTLSDDQPVYLLEDDFIHRHCSTDVLLDGIAAGFDYVTCYDHPDKYIHKSMGGNPLVTKGGESTRVLVTHKSHWKITNSTVMTFATTPRVLKRDWRIILRHCGGRYTDDYRMFRELARRRRYVYSSLPGLCTHSEVQHLSPLVDWNSELVVEREQRSI